MTRSAGIIAALVWLALPATARGQAEERPTPNTVRAEAGAKPAAATLADVRWLTGAWAGTGMGGTADEMFGEPAAGAMVGTFRLVVKNAVVFYQFLNMAEDNGSLVLRLKHFNADMTGWEEKGSVLTFRLVRMTPTEALFNGLTFRRAGDTGLQIFLAQRVADGSMREAAFDLRRVYTPVPGV